VERDEAWGQRLFVVAKAVETQGERNQKMKLGYGRLGQ
jgi:tRNA (mo5U34)-methyltransferase